MTIKKKHKTSLARISCRKGSAKAKFTLFIFVTFGLVFSVSAQLQIESTPLLIDFEDFTGAGFSPDPSAGMLNSNTWSVTGFFEDVEFGDTSTHHQLSRGIVDDRVIDPGIYAFHSGTEKSLKIQPTGSGWTPGTITLKLTNGNSTPITSLAVSYDLDIVNDKDRTNSFDLSWSHDGVNFTPVPGMAFSSPEIGTETLVSFFLSDTITSMLIPPADLFYLRWSGNDVAGHEARDEFIWDNILLQAFNETYTPIFEFTDTVLTVSENDALVSIEIGLPAPENCNVEIVVQEGSARNNLDFFVPFPATLYFNLSGPFRKSAPFELTDNSQFEFTEKTILALRNPTGGCAIGPDSLITITILDDDTSITKFLPAVTDISKISALEGGFTGALDPMDRFANRVAYWDDLDGDGNREWIAAAYSDDDGGFQIGAYWVLFPDAEGQIQSSTKISQTSNWPGAALDPEDQFGSAVVVLDDLDGDGIRELAVGALFDDDGGTDRGAVYIMYANTDGSIRSSVKISQTSGGFGGVLQNGDRFGGGIAWMGDLDGDGNNTLAVGAHGDDLVGSNSGAIWMLTLDTNEQVISEFRIGQGAGGFTDSLGVEDAFGFSVTNAGDIDGDGVSDMATGVIGRNITAPFQGGAYILFLNPDGTVRNHSLISSGTNFSANLQEEDRFGTDVAYVPDLDNDGVPELAVAAQFDDVIEENEGSVWILFLTDSGTVKYYSKIAEGIDMVDGYFEVYDELGSGIAVNPDPLPGGAIEIIVGSQGDDDGGESTGALYRFGMDNRACDTAKVPGGQSVELLGPDHVRISWSDLAFVDSYEWRGRQLGVPGFKRKILTTNSVEFTGLNPGQNYGWNVRARCEDTSFSKFSIIDFFTMPPLFLCGDTVKDFRDGQLYPTVQIGTQCWMTKNMNYDPGTDGVYEGPGSSHPDSVGLFYNWTTAKGIDTAYLSEWYDGEAEQGVCPVGWHVPTLEEWRVVEAVAEDDGRRVKKVGQGILDGAGTDELGLSLMAAGARNGKDGIFYRVDSLTVVWSSTQSEDTTSAWRFATNYKNSTILVNFPEKFHAFPVRCLKDDVGPFLRPEDPTVLSPGFEIKLRPNPAQKFVWVNTLQNDAFTLRIFDLSGRVVKTLRYSSGSNEVEVPLQEIPPGIYIVHVESNGMSAAEQLIVVH